MAESDEREGMHQRRITLADGRYLIFYTFDEPSASTVGHAAADPLSQREPEAAPEAEGERRV
jgi:hypothetical protein